MNNEPVIPDGYTDLAPGKIASVVTYLEMRSRPPLPDLAAAFVALRRVSNPELDWYRLRYRRAGARWFWFSRLQMTDEQLTALLHLPPPNSFWPKAQAARLVLPKSTVPIP